ncbi:IS200/IS605 family transposase [Danxiaibacter flavus]|uniref:IS200/IS605 family transposase n=1 Tax=Danxiaibacter flavus TaxID=3049108 RepID=A0ABV3ZML9_9BACT|nr:IS200/IS605 family transposase [Chitinophagaceae bacterium DXS]
MANTYTQIYVHFVFAVQCRTNCIGNHWKKDLYQYIAAIIQQHKHILYVINGMPDHVHILVSMHASQSPSELIYHIKRSSSLWINENKLVPGKFSWQDGFGAFTYGKSQIPNVISYIENQEAHHKKLNFKQEYIAFLKAFGIDYDERYIFKMDE